MSKPISSYPKAKQGKVVSSRLNSKTGGLGYLAALDAGDAIYRAKMEALRKKIVKSEAVTP
jgi:hypothetical protein